VLMMSPTRWDNAEGDRIREAIKICPKGAVIANE